MHVLISALHRSTKPTGVCRHAVNLAQCLAETQQVTKVTLLVGTWQQQYFETAFNLDADKINLTSIDIKNNSLTRNLWFLLALPKLANQHRPDIVHLSFPLPFVQSYFPCQVVTTIHDLYPYECPENFGRFQAIFNRLFLRQCISQSDGLTCVSQEALKQLKFFFPEVSTRGAVTVTYNSVDFTNTVPQCPALFRNRDNSSFLLSVGQHRKNKNLHLLIQTFSNLVKNQDLKETTELILVGSPGPETENLKHQIAALGLQSRIRLLDSVSDQELCWLYRHCLLLVVASSVEGFCLPLAEALSLGCKVVCSDIPILREVAADDCVYFSLKEDPVKNLERIILEVMHTPSYNTHQEFRFSKATIATQYLSFYSRVLEHSQP